MSVNIRLSINAHRNAGTEPRYYAVVDRPRAIDPANDETKAHIVFNSAEVYAVLSLRGSVPCLRSGCLVIPLLATVHTLDISVSCDPRAGPRRGRQGHAALFSLENTIIAGS